MTTRILTLFVTLVFAGAVNAELKLVPDNWSEDDTKRQVIQTVIYVLDAGTTADIKNHDDIEEEGPLARRVLGRQPEQRETALYFAGLSVANYAISAALPPNARKWWQRAGITVGGAVVGNNYRIGLRWGF